MLIATIMKKALLILTLALAMANAFVVPNRQPSPVLVNRLSQNSDLGRHDDRTSTTTSLPATYVASNGPTVPSGLTTKISSVQLKSYIYDGYNLTYLCKPASPKYRNAPPILLIHPVGIGMSSWFWKRLMEEDGPAMYGVDLIGCGLAHGADAWDPNERGMSAPLAWVKACEALMQRQVLGKAFPSLPFTSSSQYTVVAQGGLAPVGLLLTARNLDKIRHLVLTSPPTDLTTAVAEKELARNYEFFSSRITAPFAFGLLETRAAVKFFSNLFLFDKPCDDTWLDEAGNETCQAARPPVQVFNAGFCQARSYEPELEALANSASTRVLVLQGEADTPRIKDRTEYYTKELADKCEIVTLPGKNVLPWESPKETNRAVRDFLGLP